MLRKCFPLVVVLAWGCSKEDPDYDLGYSDGCALGRQDAAACDAKDARVNRLEDEETDYGQGVYAGYNECYEVTSVLVGCGIDTAAN